MGYEKRWGSYRIRLNKGDITQHRELLLDLLKLAAEKEQA
jgi:hypothetical protein